MRTSAVVVLIVTVTILAVFWPESAEPQTFSGWLQQERVWAESAQPVDMAGACFDARLPVKSLSLGARACYSGLPSEFKRDQIETVRSANAYATVGWRFQVLPAVSFEPTLVLGYAATLETKDGIKPVLPKRMTVGLGAQAFGESWSAGLFAGQHHALHKVGVGARWSVRVAGSPAGKAGEIRNTGLVACDRSICVAETAIAVRFW